MCVCVCVFEWADKIIDVPLGFGKPNITTDTTVTTHTRHNSWNRESLTYKRFVLPARWCFRISYSLCRMVNLFSLLYIRVSHGEFHRPNLHSKFAVNAVCAETCGIKICGRKILIEKGSGVQARPYTWLQMTFDILIRNELAVLINRFKRAHWYVGTIN